jgi:hypothetical protein
MYYVIVRYFLVFAAGDVICAGALMYPLSTVYLIVSIFS